MQNKRVMFGLLALFVLLALLAWKFLAARSPITAVAKPMAVNSGALAEAVQHPAIVVPAPKSAVEPPKLPPAKVSESAPAAASDNDPSVNNWGEIEFTDGVPVIRTLGTGETCIIVPTVVPLSEGREVQFNMLIEAPGSVPAIAGLLGQDALNAELSAARMDSSKKIIAQPGVTTTFGQEVAIGISATTTDSPGSPTHFSIHFKPKLSGQ